MTLVQVIAMVCMIIALIVLAARLPTPMSDALIDDLYASVLREDHVKSCPYCGGHDIQKGYGTCSGCGYKREE